MSKYWISGDLTPEDLSDMLRSIREDYLKLEPKDMADTLGVDEDRYLSFENPKGNTIGIKLLHAVCDKFNLVGKLVIEEPK